MEDMEAPAVASWGREVLNIWHANRISLLVSAVLFGIIFVGLRWRRGSLSVGGRSKHTLLSLRRDVLQVDEKQALPPPQPDPIAVEKRQDVVTNKHKTKQAPRAQPKRVVGSKDKRKTRSQSSATTPVDELKLQPYIFFSTITGTTQTHAKKCQTQLIDWISSSETYSSAILSPQLHDLSYIDYDDYFISPPKENPPSVKSFYVLLIPTYDIDTELKLFLDHLRETHHDFRIDTAPLSGLLGYSVFGFGDREGWPTEEQGFCSQAKEIDRWMAKLTDRKRAYPLGIGDVKSDAAERLEEWSAGVIDMLQSVLATGSLGEGVKGSGDAVESDEEEENEEETFDDIVDGAASVVKARSTRPPKQRRKNNASRVDDLEDLGLKVPSATSNAESTDDFPLPVDFTTSSTSKLSPPPSLKQMVPKSSPTYAALTKQGYTIIGSHSGVKLCRWLKSALRGRGSCYKYSFYGIASHLCMETTPSLSCSNKCVFCWRHGTNPVGTTWRWEVDPPELIFEGAKAAHLQKVKMLRGVPGVRADRFEEAKRIRHCALSLVGEPIFYPHINEFVALLHRDRISSFLVCNAQHPDQLAALKVVTQLYVSIDASNRESLRKVDRPLHRDFWERFLRCLDILKERRNRMRTVYRLTLVKGFNIDDEAEGYADLVARGLPCFVEVKGVTYCGTSTSASAGLTMQNVPFYEEVAAFVVALNKALEKRGLGYGIAAEHAHSCCVLIASNTFKRQGKWHTLIDYQRFFELLESGVEFSPEDYMGMETPESATWGRGGFDPRDDRVDRKGNPRPENESGRIVEAIGA